MFKISTFVITHFNTTVRFMTGTKQYGRDHVTGEPPSHCPVTAQITLSSVHLNLATRGVDCFHALWNEKFLLSFGVFCVTKTNLYFIEHKLQCFFSSLRLFYSFITVLHVLGTKLALNIDN